MQIFFYQSTPLIRAIKYFRIPFRIRGIEHNRAIVPYSMYMLSNLNLYYLMNTLFCILSVRIGLSHVQSLTVNSGKTILKCHLILL
jgi:hypothetical protein